MEGATAPPVTPAPPMRRGTRPTLEDVAQRAGVSRALVSLALKGSTRVAASTRETIWAAAEELGYRPNLAARNLASHRTSTIGVLLNDLHNPFFAEVYDGITEAASSSGHQLLLTTSQNRRTGERQAIESMIEHRVDGVVLVGALLPSNELTALAHQIPMTVVGRTLRSEVVDCVTGDDAAGARLVVEHLAELGHQHIAHIDGGTGAGASVRRAGFLRAAEEFSIERTTVIDGEFTEAAGVLGAQTILRRKARPTAVFGANDLVAVGAMDAFRQNGVSIPEDMALVGYDNTAIARLTQVHLTSIAQPTAEMGRAAVEALVTRMGGRSEPHIESLSPTLVVRSTSSAALTLKSRLPTVDGG